MAYKVDAWVEVGAFGRFKYGGKKLVETWQALEDLCYEIHWCAGIYSAWNLLDWAKTEKLLTAEEIEMFEKAIA